MGFHAHHKLWRTGTLLVVDHTDPDKKSHPFGYLNCGHFRYARLKTALLGDPKQLLAVPYL